VQELWQESEATPHPVSGVENLVGFQSWPADFEVPESCKDFTFNAETINFRGMMKDSQREVLLKLVKTKEQADGIEDLYAKSRLIHWKTTL
jgi:hypothetical protein